MFTKVSSAPSKAVVLNLYRAMLKDSLKFDNYNFREYFLRKTKHEFHKNSGLTESQDVINAYNEAIKQYEVLKRQSTISQMYIFEKSVVEGEHAHHSSH